MLTGKASRVQAKLSVYPVWWLTTHTVACSSLKRELQACMQWKKHWVTGTVVECSLVWTGASWRQQAVSIHRVKSKHPWRVTCESYATIRTKLFQVILCQASLREISLAAGKVIAPPHTYTASYILRSTARSLIHEITIQFFLLRIPEPRQDLASRVAMPLSNDF